MNAPQGPAAPASGPTDDILPFEELAADPEIAALLDFEPVPMRKRVNGWDADAQRAFVVLLATTGSKLHAAAAIQRNAAGVERILKRPECASFKGAVDKAMAIAAKRNGLALAQGVAAVRKTDPAVPSPGQVINEHGEWEDEESFKRRGEEAAESIAGKLLRIRRLYLAEISACPGKRAAFEILTDLPVDWDKAERGEPQPDEPWNPARARQPDMILTAESGWSFGDIGYGLDRKAEARRAIDAYRADEGLPPVDWGGDSPSPLEGEGGWRSEPGEGCAQ